MTARRLFGPEILGAEAVSRCSMPTPLVLQDRVRVFVSSLDANGRSRIYAVDLDQDDLSLVTATRDPVMELGQPGEFDEDGTTPSCVVSLPDGRVRLYYIGWNRSVGSVSYRLSIGSAISDDGCYFQREFDGPLLDRSRHDPILVTAPHVQQWSAGYSMLYISGTRWVGENGQLEPCYGLTRAYSEDGINWGAPTRIPLPLPSDAIGRPTIFTLNGRQILACSHRGSFDYRTNTNHGYKLAFLEYISDCWTTITSDYQPLGDREWCTVMRCYGNVIKLRSHPTLLYNGDGFGGTGVLAAPLILDEN